MKLTIPQTELLWRIAEAPFPVFVHPSYRPRLMLEKHQLIHCTPGDRCALTAAGWVALRPAWVPATWTFRVFREGLTYQEHSCTASVLLPDGRAFEVIKQRTLLDAAHALRDKLAVDGLVLKDARSQEDRLRGNP